MPLSIIAVAGAAYLTLGLPLGLAIVVGAMLAPTDPVLASGFGAGPPGHGEEGETKFALTSEAGLNDGLAFPFVMLGLTLAGLTESSSLWNWALLDLFWDVIGGAFVGIAVGWVIVAINRYLPPRLRLSASKSGLVSVGLSFLAYGTALSLQCNGFVAVFCEAVAIRNFAKGHEYSQRLNHAAEQFERFAMVGVLVLLGVSLEHGQLDEVGWSDAIFAVVVLLLVRPISVLIGCLGSKEDKWGRIAIGYFGIRGIASLYYITFVGMHFPSADGERLTAVISLVILASAVLYGTTGDIAARYFIRDNGRNERPN